VSEASSAKEARTVTSVRRVEGRGGKSVSSRLHFIFGLVLHSFLPRFTRNSSFAFDAGANVDSAT